VTKASHADREAYEALTAALCAFAGRERAEKE
jgi:hypothetical protein